MLKKNVFLPFLVTAILIFSLSAPLFLDVLVLEIFSRSVPSLLGMVVRLLNILLIAYCVPSVVKTAKELHALFRGCKLK